MMMMMIMGDESEILQSCRVRRRNLLKLVLIGDD